MGKKEKIFPINTIGGRIYELRNGLGFNTPSGRVDFYNFLYDNVEIDDSSKSKNVYNWECSEDSIPIPVLKKICEKCHCSSDYLIGIEKEVNHDLHFICNYTGLSEDAVNTLSILKEFNKDYDQYRKPVELEALNFIMKDSEKFREFIGYISALFIGADKAFYRDKEDKKWRFISDSIHVTYPTSKNSNEKQTANTGLLNIKSLAETDCIRHIELLLEDWKQEFKK